MTENDAKRTLDEIERFMEECIRTIFQLVRISYYSTVTTGAVLLAALPVAALVVGIYWLWTIK